MYRASVYFPWLLSKKCPGCDNETIKHQGEKKSDEQSLLGEVNQDGYSKFEEKNISGLRRLEVIAKLIENTLDINFIYLTIIIIVI